MEAWGAGCRCRGSELVHLDWCGDLKGEGALGGGGGEGRG